MSMSKGFTPPLTVMGFLATRRGDPDRGPEVRLNGQEASILLLVDGDPTSTISDSLNTRAVWRRGTLLSR